MASSTVPARVSHSRGRYPLRWLTRSSLTCPYSALQRASASADMSASANVLTIARSRSGLAAARLSSARECRGTLSGAVIVLSPSRLRHFEDQPVAVHLCGHHPDAGANPRIRSNPYTTSLDATVRPARTRLRGGTGGHPAVVGQQHLPVVHPGESSHSPAAARLRI